ncbi:hypothetical protein V6N13_138474 [Hibiscus sabdariffa]|uniref:Uncharacterized protein n=1 Tax=Hibiscus sabdariffa TaxID=183260 RepID=A0ABR2QE21_9ROSI
MLATAQRKSRARGRPRKTNGVPAGRVSTVSFLGSVRVCDDCGVCTMYVLGASRSLVAVVGGARFCRGAVLLGW